MAPATFKWLRSVFWLWDKYQIHFQNTLGRSEWWRWCIKSRLWPFWLDSRIAWLQELAISAVGVDDHSKRHFTGMQCRAVQCSAFFPAPPPGLSVLRYIQPTTFHPKMCPREEILCAQNVLCSVIKFKRNVQQLKLDQTSFNQSFSKIKSLVMISVSSQVHHSDNIL